jgi:transposase-like protein
MSPASTTELPIASIRLDGGTQPRAAIDFNAVDDYMDAMTAGAKFPPVTVFYDGSDYWLADGFHRIKAAFGGEREVIACDVHQGTREEAQWFSFSANKTNGLRRTNEDKQRAVKAALRHSGAAGRSNVQIAAHVGVDEGTVRAWREKLTSEIPKSAKRTGRDGRTIDTSKIGKRESVIETAAKATGVSVAEVERAIELKKADPAAFERVKRGELTLEAGSEESVPAVKPGSARSTTDAIVESVQELQRLIQPREGRFLRFGDFLRSVPPERYSEMADTFRCSRETLLRISKTFRDAIKPEAAGEQAGKETAA